MKVKLKFIQYLILFVLATGSLIVSIVALSKSRNDKSEHSIKGTYLNQLNDTSSYLAAKNEILSTALEVNNNIFDATSIYLAVISILLTILLVAAPIVGYLYVLKPTNKTLKKLKKLERDLPITIKDHFGPAFDNYVNRKSKEMVSKLQDPTFAKEAAHFLTVNKFAPLDEADLHQISIFLNSDRNLEPWDKVGLYEVLGRKNSVTADIFFRDLLFSERGWERESIKYFMLYNVEELKKLLQTVLHDKDETNNLLSGISEFIAYTGLPGANDNIHRIQYWEQVWAYFLNKPDICSTLLGEKNSTLDDLISDDDFRSRHSFLVDTLYFNQNYDEKGKRKKKLKPEDPPV